MQYMTLIKNLALSYQAFEGYSAKHIRETGLTVTQFDILATLGNQPPMTCKELGEKTLVHKGTMTGVLERLEAKGLVKKIPNPEDGRSTKIGLTKSGEKMFKKTFPEHLQHLEAAFGKLKKKEIQEAIFALQTLQRIFD
jgi:MarR family 2-MHQ and catechol resistance regulon transcriptional repressor